MDMKRAIWALSLGLWVCTVLPAYAQDVRIGYVDMRKVLTESKAGKRVKAEIEKTIGERRASLGRDEQQLKDLQQAYEKDKLLLSEEQKQAKQKEFDEKLRAFQQATATAQREIEQKEREFARKVIPEIRTIVRDLAKERKLSLVFEKNEMPVIYAADGPDLTEAIIKRFDAKGGG